MNNLLWIRPENDWKTLGEIDPYYGVLSAEKFKSSKLDDKSREQFFASGVAHVNRVFDVLKDTFGVTPNGKALDFGCGVGRITGALAPHFETVIGLDIAPGMITEAARIAEQHHLSNIRYALSDSNANLEPDSYDFVHSYIVFQHIPVRVGEAIIRDILSSLKIGGIGAIHFTYGETGSELSSLLKRIAKNTPILRNVANAAAGRKWNYPCMQMNRYSIPRMIEILAEAGVSRFVAVRVDDWGNLGLFIFFSKGDTGALSPWSNPRRP